MGVDGARRRAAQVLADAGYHPDFMDVAIYRVDEEVRDDAGSRRGQG